MKTELDNAARAGRTERATDIMLIQNPLDFIAEDHLRAKTVAETMRRVAEEDVPQTADLNQIETFLTNELPLLLHDEDDQLFALLRQRVCPSAEFDALIAQLNDTHQTIEHDRKDLMMRIEKAQRNGGQLTPEDRAKLADAAKSLIAEMIVENGKLLPLAQETLTGDDLAILRGNMIQRRISNMREARDNAS